MITDAQRQLRRNGIGGSDAAAAIGLSPYKTRYQLWREKLGFDEPTYTESQKSKNPQYWGSALEHVIASRFAEENKTRVRLDIDTMRHKEHEWMIAHPDGMLPNGEGLEIKTADYHMAKLWGAPGSDAIPDEYLIQCHHYMAVTDAPRWHIAALIAGNDYRTYVVERDEKFLEDLINSERFFWEHVTSAIEPELQTLKDLALRYPHGEGSIIATPEIYECCKSYLANKRQIKQLDEENDRLATHVQSLMGACDSLLFDNQTIATWRTREIERVDVSTLRQKHPDIATECLKKTSSRIFLVKNLEAT